MITYFAYAGVIATAVAGEIAIIGAVIAGIALMLKSQSKQKEAVHEQ